MTASIIDVDYPVCFIEKIAIVANPSASYGLVGADVDSPLIGEGACI